MPPLLVKNNLPFPMTMSTLFLFNILKDGSDVLGNLKIFKIESQL